MSAADTRRADTWPNRDADVRTSTAAAAPLALPPSLAALDDPGQIRALRNAYHLGLMAGEASGQQDAYVGGWRFGVVCGFLAGGIVFCGLFKLGYLMGLAS